MNTCEEVRGSIEFFIERFGRGRRLARSLVVNDKVCWVPFSSGEKEEPFHLRDLNASFSIALNIDSIRSKNCINDIVDFIKNSKAGVEVFFWGYQEPFRSMEYRDLNSTMYAKGSITHLIGLGSNRESGRPIAFWRYEVGDYRRNTIGESESFKYFCENGVAKFINPSADLGVRFSELFDVYPGAKSGCDRVFYSQEYGNELFVTPMTATGGVLQNCVWEDSPGEYMLAKKHALLERKRSEKSWWKWERKEGRTDGQRVYASRFGKEGKIFFLSPCNRYDSNILGVFPKISAIDLEGLCGFLNQIDWKSKGCSYSDGKLYFTKERLMSSFVDRRILNFLNG